MQGKLWLSGNMAGNAFKELEKPHPSLKSAVWEHFAFAVEYVNGQRQVDKSKAVCRHCFAEIGYALGSTTNLFSHLRRHHGYVNIGPRKTSNLVLTKTSQQRFSLERVNAITNSIGVFLAADLRPFSVVENSGFKHMMGVIEPRYQVPSPAHFRQKIIPSLYEKNKSAVMDHLSRASAVALIADGWTCRAAVSYITVTAHYITPEWTLASHVLQTRVLCEQTSTHIAEELKRMVLVWNLERSGATMIPVTTDNAGNMADAVSEAGLGPQIGCFAHTINVAAEKVTGLNQVSRVLGKVRRIVSFFHRSTTAAHLLESKQEMLNTPKHDLIHDVTTRWNSSYDMLERYLEQHTAAYAALTDRSLKRKKDVTLLTDQEVRTAEEVIEVLKPLKAITTLMSTESAPSASMILPLKSTLLNSMEPNVEDTATVSEIKAAIRENLEDRYTACQDYLHKCTALDPRFKGLPHVDEACRDGTFSGLITEITIKKEENADATGTTAVSSTPVKREHNLEASPPLKKSAMTEVFGELFKAQVGQEPTLQLLVKEEVAAYRMVSCISLDSDPLLWWKSNEPAFPHLAQLAKKYLAIPAATSVTSRGVFATAGDIGTANGSALSEDCVDKMIFLAKNMKAESN
uniref:zinc finger BED domain-containing protein 4 n=1 Tax=Doryrhamphus excisus TaxID=161450 RepID=UPI0025AE795E|nr:zinc finger BED domain-containing protein 4 [Doryrhamphus excisus]